jgi:hypothetical protein
MSHFVQATHDQALLNLVEGLIVCLASHWQWQCSPGSTAMCNCSTTAVKMPSLADRNRVDGANARCITIERDFVMLHLLFSSSWSCAGRPDA